MTHRYSATQEAGRSAQPDALRLDGLAKRFGGVHAVDGVSLRVARGERIAIVGTNGAGKSTLLKLIAGELSPTAGRMWLFDEEITSLLSYERARRGIGRSFQVSRLFGTRSVCQNAWLGVQGAANWRYGSTRSVHRYREEQTALQGLLTEWDLWEQRDQLAAELSYGDQRRLEIVLALSVRPRLLLMDEPTAGQTQEESEQLSVHLRGLPRELTSIIIAHDMDLVFGFADRIIVMHEGRVVADDVPAAIADDAFVRQAYLGGG